MRYTLAASVLWLAISAALMIYDRIETGLMLEQIRTSKQGSHRTWDALEAEVRDRSNRELLLHVGLWVAVQCGLLIVSLQMAQRIRERRAVRAQLQMATARLEAIVHQPALGYVRVNRDGRIVEANAPWLAMHGFERSEDAMGTEYSVDCAGGSLPQSSSLVEAVIHGQIPPLGEAKHAWPDGSVTHHAYSLHPIGTNGTSTGLEGFVIDITGRKLADDARKESEQKYRTLFENHIAGFALHEMIFNADGEAVDYRFLEVNPAFERILGLPSSAVVGRCVRDVFPSIEEEWIARYGSVVTTGVPVHFEMELRIEHRFFEVQAFRPAPGQFATVFLDVTDRHTTHESLRRSLEEKTDLVQELHHRVKNNLQVLSSLINLHLPHLSDVRAREMLQTYQRRIRSIALVHEAVYHANDFSRVDLREFVHMVARDHQRTVPGPVVTWTIHAETAFLPLELAIPWGMIVSELVVNAVHHAFQGRTAGEVIITLREDETCVEIVVEDNGVGFTVPGRREMDSRMGLALVDMLTEQLQGDCEIVAHGGTRCRLRVPRR